MILCSYCKIEYSKTQDFDTTNHQRIYSHLPITAYICSTCRTSISFNKIACCHCAEPLKLSPTTQSDRACPSTSPTVCDTCQKQPVSWQAIVAPLVYEYPIKESVHQFKFHKKFIYGRALIQLLLEKISDFYAHRAFPELMIPVPQHRTSQLARGFHPTQWLAKQLACHLKLPIQASVVRKVRKTVPQNQLSLEERRHNLDNAFSLSNNPSNQDYSQKALNQQTRLIKQFSNRRLVILDDVMTTGATIKEVIKTLTPLSPTEIHVWCLARTPNEQYYAEF